MTTTSSDGKTTAIISYITFVGLIIAIIMNSSDKNSFASYHIRNMIGLSLAGLALTGLDSMILPDFVVWPLRVALIVLWVIGFIGAVQGEEKEIPIVGKLFQDWFRSI